MKVTLEGFRGRMIVPPVNLSEQMSTNKALDTGLA
jgi:hypothetical protein